MKRWKAHIFNSPDTFFSQLREQCPLAIGIQLFKGNPILYIFSSSNTIFLGIRSASILPCNPHQGRASPLDPNGHLAQVISLLELHLVYRTSSNEPLLFYHPYGHFSTKKKKKNILNHVKYTSGSARSSMPNVLKYTPVLSKSAIEAWTFIFQKGGDTKILAPG